MLKRLFFEEKGEDMIEYALLAVLIAIALIAFLPNVATAIQAVFQRVIDALGAA
jgi:pilus assembly protein Flp/PilA